MTGPEVTIHGLLAGWCVTVAGTGWQPDTARERAMPPQDYARLVASRVGGMYVAPRAASVVTLCRGCGSAVPSRIDQPAPECCYWCAAGTTPEQVAGTGRLAPDEAAS